MTRTMHTAINAFEVFEIARRIERNGDGFYRKAAEHAISQDLRQTLLNLADGEDRRGKTFAEMAEQLRYDERKITLLEPVTEIAENLSAIADSKVFNLRDNFSGQLTGKETNYGYF